MNAFLKAEQKSETDFAVYNVGSGQKTSVETVVETIKNQLKSAISSKYEGSTPGDQFGIYADCNSSKYHLGWEAEVSFEEGIEKMINWARVQMK